jgi:RNA polymerase sigma factor (sigma-70 family)
MPGQSESFRDFIDHLQTGDEEAWKTLRKMILFQARKYPAIGIVDPEELTHDVMMKIQGTIGTYQPEKGKGTIEQNFRRWVSMIVSNTYKSHWKHEKRHISTEDVVRGLHLPQNWQERVPREPEAIEASLFSPSDNPETIYRRRQVLALVECLDTPRKRLAAYDYYILGCTIKETALRRGEKEDAMNTLLMRDIKNELRQIAKERRIDPRYLDT